MLHTLIVACTIITSSLTTTAPNHRRLLAAAPDHDSHHEGFIIGYEQTDMQIMWGNTNESPFNNKSSLGDVNAWLEGGRTWDTTHCFIYQDNNRLIGGFQQLVTDIYGDDDKYSVKGTSWGINQERDGYEKKSIGMCKAWNHNLGRAFGHVFGSGDWGNSKNFIFVKSGVIAGFKQLGNDAHCGSEWRPLSHSWGIQEENDQYKEFYLGSCRAWNPRHQVWGYSTRRIYVNRKYLLPEEYTLRATIDQFDFGEDINQRLNASAVAFTDECHIDATIEGYTASGQHCTSSQVTDSYSLTFSQSLCRGTEVSANINVPTLGSAGVTISDTFTSGSSNTRTISEARATSITQGYKFVAKRPGRYVVKMTIWQIVNEPLPFTARVRYAALAHDGSFYPGRVVNALVHLNGGSNVNITHIGELEGRVSAVVRGVMTAKYAVKSYRSVEEVNITRR